MFSSYQNQSIDLHCRSIDWFLYNWNIRLKWIKLIKEMICIFCYYDDKQFWDCLESITFMLFYKFSKIRRDHITFQYVALWLFDRKVSHENVTYYIKTNFSLELIRRFSRQFLLMVYNLNIAIIYECEWCSRNRSSHPEVFCKKGVLRNFQNSQENACARVSFLIKLQA